MCVSVVRYVGYVYDIYLPLCVCVCEVCVEFIYNTVCVCVVSGVCVRLRVGCV